MASRDELPEEVIAHYGLGNERSRLSSGSGRLEREPTLLGLSAHLLAVMRR